MKRDALISRLKQLLNAVDKLEFNVEQNRKQIAETRLLVANVARAVYFAKQAKPKSLRAQAVKVRLTKGRKQPSKLKR